MKVVCVTGGDSKFFLHMVLLLNSFDRYCPGYRLHICDFGLTEAEISYLRRRAEVLVMPEELRDVSHTWYRKGAIDLYLKGVAYDAVVWIDADCMVLSDVVSELAEISLRENATVLACPVFGQSIAHVIAENEQAGRGAISVFKDMVAQNGLSFDLPYVSVGVFICRSRPLLEEWRRATLVTPPHPMFEQNVFNTLIHKNRMLTVIDCDMFNVTGADLNRLTRRDDGIIVNGAGQPVRVAHMTSSVDGVLEILDLKISMGAKVLTGMMRRPTNPVLRAFQHSLIEPLAAEAQILDACGLLKDS